MKVEIIEGAVRVSEHGKRFGVQTLDEKVTDFLADNPDILIRHIKQSSASSGDRDSFSSVTTISIWYEYEEDC